MIVKVCRKGHELTADLVMKDGRCKICYRAKIEKIGKERLNEYSRNTARRKRSTPEGREHCNRLKRESKARAKQAGTFNRDIEREAAARRGVTVEELRQWRAGRAEVRQQRNMERAKLSAERKIITDAMSHNAHVKAYRSSSEYQRAKSKDYYYRVNSNGELLGHRKIKDMTDGYIASKIGLPLALLPRPLLELKREILRAKRVCREIQQH